MNFNAPVSLAEHIASHIADRIICGDMVSNEHIQEARIVSQLEVSRGSVREALLLLEKRHLVTIQANRGAFVTELTAERVITLYDLYANLLIMFSVQVAKNWREDNVQDFIKQAQKLQQVARTGDQNALALACFDVAYSAFPLSGNEYLNQALEDLHSAIHRTYALALRHAPHGTETSRIFFADLVSAVLKRDVESIPDIINQFSEYQQQLILSALKDIHAVSVHGR